MALDLSGDLSVFFNSDEFAVSCTLPSSAVVKVILSTPDQESFGEMIVSADAKMTGKTSDLSTLRAGNAVTVNSVAYTVKKTLKIDDGLISDVYLSRNI